MFALLGRSLHMWPQKIRAAMLLGWFGAVLWIMPADAQMPRANAQQTNTRQANSQQDNTRQANSQTSSRAKYPPLRFAEQTGSTHNDSSRSVLSSSTALAMPITEEERAPLSSDDNESLRNESLRNESLRFEADNENFYFTNEQATCDSTGNCTTCGKNDCWNCDGWDLFPNCSPPGLFQWLHAKHESRGSCWSGQVDAVLLWRNSPPTRELATFSGGGSALDAHQFESALAGGPRLGVIHKDSCGNIAEFVYLRAFNFRSQRSLPPIGSQYETANIFGVATSFDQASANLGSSFQTFEANSKTPMGKGSFNFIAGFRWLEFQESFSMNTTGVSPNTTFRSDTVNSLYGGQLGIDAWILTTPLVQINTWLKGGAYYNNAVQRTSLQTTGVLPPFPGIGSFSRSVARSPAAGSFVGEVGINGTMPLAPCVDFRFGYTAFWLETIAMATQQLENQNALSTNGGTVLQGINFGLEGKW